MRNVDVRLFKLLPILYFLKDHITTPSHNFGIYPVISIPFNFFFTGNCFNVTDLLGYLFNTVQKKVIKLKSFHLFLTVERSWLRIGTIVSVCIKIFLLPLDYRWISHF